MIATSPYRNLVLMMSLVTGAAVLAGCGPRPVTQTSTTTTERVTTTPTLVPGTSTTTTETIRRP